MGWSCRIEASETLEKIQKLLNQDYNINLGNGMPDGFYNVNTRLEHIDGSITGSVFKNLNNDMCKKVGSFKIEGNGFIKRFPMLPSSIKNKINQYYKI